MEILLNRKIKRDIVLLRKNKLKEGKIEREIYCTSFDEDKIKYKKYLDKQREEKKAKK